MSGNVTHLPRVVRAAPSPLGLYLRPSHGDHCQLTNLLLAGQQRIFGAVIDASMAERHSELRDQLAAGQLDIILDPRTQPSATPGGWKESLGRLPWGTERPHIFDDFRQLSGRQRIVKLAEFVICGRYTQVMAPTHLITSPNDVWLGIDAESTRWLRIELDRRGGRRIPIVYSLALARSAFCDPEQRAALIAAIADLPINSLWLKIDGFGADATPTGVARYLDAAADFHAVGVPVIADQVGGLPALTLLAFGAVGGIAHGITANESFSSYSWRKPQERRGGAGGWRIYIPSIDLMLTQTEASKLLGSSARARVMFANRNTSACPRGVDDMLSNPVRAFVVHRAEEVASLGVVPPSLRPQSFLESHVRPATDKALASTKIDWGSDEAGLKLGKKLAAHRKRLDDMRIALGARVERMPPQSFAMLPSTRVVRESRG